MEAKKKKKTMMAGNVAEATPVLIADIWKFAYKFLTGSKHKKKYRY